jgi:RecB family exonuclease
VVPLIFKKGEKRLKIGGKIDRVDRVKDGRIEIIDYKTGANIPSQKQVDHDLQLTFYALAATKIKEEPFDKKPSDILLSLYYFDGQKKVTTQRSAKQLKEAEEKVYKWRKKIEESNFSCSGHYFCKSCEYSLMCNSEGD